MEFEIWYNYVQPTRRVEMRSESWVADMIFDLEMIDVCIYDDRCMKDLWRVMACMI